ncbi:MAG: DUF3408 domain-containing protein [Rikenellaceae bacterium]
MEKNSKAKIDTARLKELVSRGRPMRGVRESEASPVIENEVANESEGCVGAVVEDSAPPAAIKNKAVTVKSVSSRGRSQALDGYCECFLQPRSLRNRKCVYISEDSHRKILDILHNAGGNTRSNIGIFIENTLADHFDLHADSIAQLAKRKQNNS